MGHLLIDSGYRNKNVINLVEIGIFKFQMLDEKDPLNK